MDLIQVVPSLPPRLDGIGDYARKLATALQQKDGRRTHFIVGEPAWRGESVDGFQARPLRQRSASALLDLLKEIEDGLENKQIPVLVHFAVYGYQQRGVPFWLADALEAFARKRSGLLHILFHELEANDHRPWSSVFWLSSLQRRIIRMAARAASYTYTNTEMFRSRLKDWGLGRVELVPNFSTIGEPEEYPSWENRSRSLVIFGQVAQRIRAYAIGDTLLKAICDRIGIDRILDIGDNTGITIPNHIANVPVTQRGRLSEAEVFHAMATSWASFIAYPVPLLLKSSIFATSRAFGTVPFVYDSQSSQKSCLGLEAGEDYVLVDDESVHRLPAVPIEQLSRQVFMNYRKHSSTQAASTFAANFANADAAGMAYSVER